MILSASNTLYVAVLITLTIKRKQISIAASTTDDAFVIFIRGVSKYMKCHKILWTIHDLKVDIDVSTRYISDAQYTSLSFDTDRYHRIRDNYMYITCSHLVYPDIFIVVPLYFKNNIQTAHRLAQFIKKCNHCYTFDMQVLKFGNEHIIIKN